MPDGKDNSISPIVGARGFYERLRSTLKQLPKNIMPKNPSNKYVEDEFNRSDSEPLPQDVRVVKAANKANSENDLRLVAETNNFARLDDNYNQLLQQYKAYKNPSLENVEFNPVSEDTISGLYKGKPVEITCVMSEDGNKQQEIKFGDGSKISYVVFSEGNKMTINGEEFEMPEGTIVETKSVNGRIFSQLIQTPNMSKTVVCVPEVINTAEQILGIADSEESLD